jgi:glycosyltransferase involved in cell wall biosynthesis
LKILWVSNATFAPTGYGVATRAVTRQMRSHGHEPVVFAHWGLQGAPMVVDGIQHLPAPEADDWGNSMIPGYFEQTGADFVLVHRDAWTNHLETGEQVPLAGWFPVSGEPLGSRSRPYVEALRWPATMSRFAQRVCREAGLDVAYIPHSFDPAVFSYGRSRAARATLGVPEDAFLVTMVAANKGIPARKGWPEMFEAIGRLQREHDDTWFYAHTLATSEFGGFDLPALIDLVGADASRSQLLHPFVFHSGVLEGAFLAAVYQASDVVLNTSYGEGFGIPILEAQACGTPVITTNASSMPEITFHGYTVPGRRWVNNLYEYWTIPDVDEIAWALGAVRERHRSDEWVAKGSEVSEMLQREWTDEAVYEAYWTPFLERIAGDLARDGGGRPAG